MKTDFEKFNQEFFKEVPFFKHYNKKCTRQLGHGLIAEIELAIDNVFDEYTQYIVRIINLEKGVIATNSFPFSAYLKKRIDNRKDYKNNDFRIITHCGIEWYIAIPDSKEVEYMARQILKYINEFKVAADEK